jgi:hypothetical protein
MYRDVKKVLFSRGSYTGKNQEILCRPWLHSTAIYEGFKTEKVSVLIEEILSFRNRLIYERYSDDSWDNMSSDVELLKEASDRYKWAFVEEGSGYGHELMINNNLGLGWTDYYNMLDSRQIDCYTL